MFSMKSKNIIESAWFNNRILLVKKKGRFGRVEYFMGIDSGKKMPREEEENLIIKSGVQLNPQAMKRFFSDFIINKHTKSE